MAFPKFQADSESHGERDQLTYTAYSDYLRGPENKGYFSTVELVVDQKNTVIALMHDRI